MNTDYSNISYENYKIRCPIVDGIFYPDDDLLLQNNIEHLLEDSDTKPGKAMGIITPHAALPFSGDLAASSFQSVSEREIDTVVIIAPVHRDNTEKIFLTESEFFSIPTANIRVNTDIVNKFLEFDPLFFKDDIPHLEEHCIEIQLPFIAHIFPNATIVPILLGDNSVKLTKTLSEAIKSVFNNNFDKTLLVSSSNIVSYLLKENADDYFEYLLNLIKTGSTEDILAELEKCKTKSKGFGCIATLLSLAGDNAEINVLGKKDSTKNGKKGEKVVCYASITVDKKD
jgi:AmmeMemoRadiSam system protein B